MADEFIAECRNAVIELYGENPKENPDYSRIINAREGGTLCLHQLRIESYRK